MEFLQLETEKLLIRPLSIEDVPTIFRLSREKSLGDWIPDQVYENEKEAAEVIAFLNSQYKPFPAPQKRPFVLGIALRRNQELIGHVGLSPLTEGEVEIGYAIGEKHQKQGYASEAVAALCEWAILNLDIPKINGIVAIENIGSGRVLEKAGFTLDIEQDQFDHAEYSQSLSQRMLNANYMNGAYETWQKFGFLFSRNALTPSTFSSCSKAFLNPALSKRRASAVDSP
jgi:[ribosomal protein S5]-alanine N-acetyltransferase